MAKLRWYKGNIHTHTTESDGDADPAKVVSWYRRHGYDFLVLSDHNHLTIFEYGAGKRRFKRPLLVPGEEVSANIKGGTVPIHINGVGLSRVVEPIDAGEVVPTIQANVNAIRQAGGIPSINHPNYKWAFDHTHLRQIEGMSMLEVFNGHPATNVYGGPGKFSYDEIWDGVLSAGVVVFGVATDDSHNYHDFAPERSNPGRGWVSVRAAELSRDAIVDGLATGEFYASSGVALKDLEVSADGVRLEIDPEPFRLYTTRFTGKDGKLLAEIPGEETEYVPKGDEGYVRAVVVSSGNTKAWTQPVFLPGLGAGQKGLAEPLQQHLHAAHAVQTVVRGVQQGRRRAIIHDRHAAPAYPAAAHQVGQRLHAVDVRGVVAEEDRAPQGPLFDDGPDGMALVQADRGAYLQDHLAPEGLQAVRPDLSQGRGQARAGPTLGPAPPGSGRRRWSPCAPHIIPSTCASPRNSRSRALDGVAVPRGQGGETACSSPSMLSAPWLPTYRRPRRPTLSRMSWARRPDSTQTTACLCDRRSSDLTARGDAIASSGGGRQPGYGAVEVHEEARRPLRESRQRGGRGLRAGPKAQA